MLVDGYGTNLAGRRFVSNGLDGFRACRSFRQVAVAVAVAVAVHAVVVDVVAAFAEHAATGVTLSEVSDYHHSAPKETMVAAAAVPMKEVPSTESMHLGESSESLDCQ